MRAGARLLLGVRVPGGFVGKGENGGGVRERGRGRGEGRMEDVLLELLEVLCGIYFTIL